MTCCFVTRAGAPPRACNQRGRSVLLWQMRAGQPQMEVLSEPWGLLVIRIGPCYSSAKKHPKASVGARSRQPCRGHQTPQRRGAWTVIKDQADRGAHPRCRGDECQHGCEAENLPRKKANKQAFLPEVQHALTSNGLAVRWGRWTRVFKRQAQEERA